MVNVFLFTSYPLFFSGAQNRATAAVTAARDLYGVAAVDLSSGSGTPSGSHRKRRSRFSTVANIADNSPGGTVTDSPPGGAVTDSSPGGAVADSSPGTAATGADGRDCLDVISQSPSSSAGVSSAGSSPRSQPVGVASRGLYF